MSRAYSDHESERRLLLLKSAFREVAEKGFSNVTLEDIAIRAGVSKGVTLYYFASKEDLFRELFGWLIDSIHQRMREAVASVEHPVEKVRALVALIFPSPSKNRAFFRAYIDFFDGLMMQWLAEKDPEATFARYRERCERELLAYLTGIPAKVVRGKDK
jgi:AcrR family transcriptional regulator